MGKLTISTGPFSIAMLVYQRVAETKLSCVWSQVVHNACPSELRVVWVRGEAVEEWEALSSSMLQYCSTKQLPKLAGKNKSGNQLNQEKPTLNIIQPPSTSRPGAEIWHRGEADGTAEAAWSTLDS